MFVSLPKELTESGPFAHSESGHLSAKTRSARLCQGPELEKTQGRHPPTHRPQPQDTVRGVPSRPSLAGFTVCTRQAPGSRALVVTVPSLADNPRHSAAAPNSFLRGFPLFLSGPPVTVRAPLKLAFTPSLILFISALLSVLGFPPSFLRGLSVTPPTFCMFPALPSRLRLEQDSSHFVGEFSGLQYLDDIRCSALALWTCCVLPV